jgi:selenocysteine lyase/cysteine desulfurase
VFEELRSHMFGNPHSANPSSSMTGDKVEEVRDLVLKYFNADPAEYQVVFTRSATGALKLVGETFPWSRCAVGWGVVTTNRQGLLLLSFKHAACGAAETVFSCSSCTAFEQTADASFDG